MSWVLLLLMVQNYISTTHVPAASGKLGTQDCGCFWMPKNSIFFFFPQNCQIFLSQILRRCSGGQLSAWCTGSPEHCVLLQSAKGPKQLTPSLCACASLRTLAEIPRHLEWNSLRLLIHSLFNTLMLGVSVTVHFILAGLLYSTEWLKSFCYIRMMKHMLPQWERAHCGL